MVLWLIFGAMAALAVGFVTWPLFRRPREAAPPQRADYDVAIYKDQLRDVERDRARGVIDESQAAAARIEVERRLLAAASAASEPALAPPAPTRGSAWRFTIVVALMLLPASTLIYLQAGAPWLADRASQPAASDPAAQFADILAEMERHLVANPDDRRGWTLLARGYLRMGRAADAQAAQARAMALAEDDGEAADIAAGFGQVLTDEARGQVTQAARAAFAEALARNPRQPQARYFLGLAKLQDGDGAGTLADWQALLADTPEEAPWRSGLAGRVAQLEQELAGGGDASSAQQAMIETMVAGLAERLAAVRDSGGGAPEEWAQLGLSYRVLGRAAESRDAYAEAVKRAPDDVALWRAYAASVAAADGEGSPAHRAALERLRDKLPMDSAERAAIDKQLVP